MGTNQILESPLVTIDILDKERGGTPKIMFNL
jgi:hypothetical protein